MISVTRTPGHTIAHQDFHVYSVLDKPVVPPEVRSWIGVISADQGMVQKIWETAVEQGLIPPSLAPAIPAAAQRFHGLSADKLLHGPAPVGPSSLDKMRLS